MHSRHAVRPARLLVDRPDAFEQCRIRSCSRRRLTLKPRVVPARGNLQQAAHHRDPADGLVFAHEPEGFFGVDCVSCANQTAAFLNISRSSRSVRFSRRSRTSSSCSSVVRPSVRLPSSRSACRAQKRIDCAVGSNSRDSAAGDRPDRDQLDHPSTELRRVRGSGVAQLLLGHRGTFSRKG